LLVQLDQKKDASLINGKFTKVDGWKQKAFELLTDLGEAQLVQEFNEAGFVPFTKEADDKESFEYMIKTVSSRREVLLKLRQ